MNHMTKSIEIRLTQGELATSTIGSEKSKGEDSVVIFDSPTVLVRHDFKRYYRSLAIGHVLRGLT